MVVTIPVGYTPMICILPLFSESDFESEFRSVSLISATNDFFEPVGIGGWPSISTWIEVAKEDESCDEEYVLISSIIGAITHESEIWLMENGASKHMTCYKYSLSNLTHNDSLHKMKLGDDYQYPMKGVGESSYKLDSGNVMKMKEVFYVHGLKKNLLSISTLDEKGYRVSFDDGQYLMWPRGNTFDDVMVIGVEEGGLYKLKG
jgi:hypothetical protein